MRRIQMIILLFVFSISAILLNAQSAKIVTPLLMPKPKHFESHGGSFKLDKSFSVGIKGEKTERLTAYVSRSLKRLSKSTGIHFKQSAPSSNGKITSSSLLITYKETGKLSLGTDESYTLAITPSQITLEAQTDIGAMRGIETLLQLSHPDFPCCTITDSPRFPWRGLMIDCSRHFMPLPVIKRNIDGMAAVKLNVFHWHLSDDQGFRAESKQFPQLQEIASNGQFYTQKEIKEIIEYAAQRGIRVVPEFDIPGHSTAFLAAFPQFASAPGTGKVEPGYGAFDPTINPTIEAVYDYFDKFFAEMAALFPDEYMHIGGDENNGSQWKANKDIRHFMAEHNIADNHALQTYFNKRINAILTAHGKKMMGWDEILHPDLPKNIVVQSWRGMQYLKEAAQKGYMNVLSNGYYIDLLYPAKDHYLVDPCPDSLNLSPEEQTRILGGETTMWSELVTPETVDTRIWPRAAAIAERFWSPASVKDVNDMYERLPFISSYLTKVGLLQETNFDKLLHQLANGQETKPFKTLLACVAPLTGYDRYQYATYTTSTNFNRAVDFISPDPMLALSLIKQVDYFLLKKKNIMELISLLDMIEHNNDSLSLLISSAPLAKELAPISILTAKLAKIGLESVMKISSEKSADKEWLDNAQATLKEAEKPIAELKIALVEPIRRLVLQVKAN